MAAPAVRGVAPTPVPVGEPILATPHPPAIAPPHPVIR